MRLDLAIFENDLPQVIVESKSWLHADVVDEKKLLQRVKSNRFNLEEDIKRLKKSTVKRASIHVGRYLGLPM